MRANAERRLLHVVDFGLAATLVGVTLAMGGRHPIADLILYVTTIGTVIAWSLFRIINPSNEYRWTWTGMEFVAVLGIAMIYLQTIELPAEIIHRLSPNLQSYLPAWGVAPDSDGLFGRWETLSVTPHATRSLLRVLASCIVFFFIVLQRIRTPEEVDGCLRLFSIFTTAVAAFAITQLIFSNGCFYGFYNHPSTDTLGVTKGPFTNENHLAHFLLLGVGVQLWWLDQTRTNPDQANVSPLGRWSKTPILLGFLCINIVSILLTQSRGGIALTTLLVAAYLFIKTNKRPTQKMAWICGSALTLLLSMTIISGSEHSDLIEHIDSPYRWIIWTANLEIIKDFPILGTGLGSHRSVHQIFVNIPYYHREFSHADNSFLQLTSEGGLLVGAVVVLTILVYFGNIFLKCRRTSVAPKHAALLVILISLHLIHSVLDFIWYVPGCMLAVILIAACLLRLVTINENARTEQAQRSSLIPRIGYSIIAAGCIVVLPGLILGAYKQSQHAICFDQVKNMVHSVSDADEDSTQRITRKIDLLSKAIIAHPNSPVTRLLLSDCYLERYRLRQNSDDQILPKEMISETASTTGFGSYSEFRQWLNRVTGDEIDDLSRAYHQAEAALRLAPFLGKTYIKAAELSFLSESMLGQHDQLIAQAVVVRPNDGIVLYRAGMFKIKSGEIEAGMKLWKRASDLDRLAQQNIMKSALHMLAANELLQTFQPDLEAVAFLKRVCQSMPETADLNPIYQEHAKICVENAQTSMMSNPTQLWLQAADSYAQLRHEKNVLTCLENAYRTSPNKYKVRRQYALRLVRNKQFSRAMTHLKWCSKRKPEDPEVIALMNRIQENH